MKYVFVTGGVASSLGKGITAASLGRLLKARGLRVSLQKMDPYYNIDQGRLSPLQRGEVYITDDGAPTDHDLGHYERFTDVTLTGDASVSTGNIYKSIMEQELLGEYRGSTIQMVPHVTNEIKRRIIKNAEAATADAAIIEIGGTVGDMECAPFLEAIRQMRWDQPDGACCFLHVTYLPTVGSEHEIKTKPTQHSVKMLRSIGIQPDIVVCRTDVPITDEARGKIALFCNVTADRVIENIDEQILYEVPLRLEAEGLGAKVLDVLEMEPRKADLTVWREMIDRALNPSRTLRVGLVGKYVSLHDAYISVAEALMHAGTAHRVKIEINWISASRIEEEGADACLRGLGAVIVPGGHGKRGAEGLIQTAAWAYENRVPYLAIGYGMQMTVAAAARSLLGLPEANTTEANPLTPDPVARVPKDRLDKTGTERSRTGGQPLMITGGSRLSLCYGDRREVRERHGNRLELNPAYVQLLSEMGVRFPAVEKREGYIEAIERPDHPFYVGVLYHPEFISRPDNPHPLIECFILAGLGQAG